MARRAAKFPDRKISETLLHFAGITPHDLPSHAPERRAREALTVACTVWNAVIFASFKAGNIKQLDTDFYFGLRSAISRRLFRYLDANERITTKEYSRLVNISEQRATRILVSLVHAGVVRIHTLEKTDFFTLAYDVARS